MLGHGEPAGVGHLGERRPERALEVVGDREVLHAATARAHEVVVVLGQVLGQLEAGELVARDDAVHDAGALEDAEVAVGRALGQVTGGAEQLGEGDRPVGALERLDEGAAIGGVALVVRPQSRCGDQVQRARFGQSTWTRLRSSAFSSSKSSKVIVPASSCLWICSMRASSSAAESSS